MSKSYMIVFDMTSASGVHSYEVVADSFKKNKAGFSCDVLNGGWRLTYDHQNKIIKTGRSKEGHLSRATCVAIIPVDDIPSGHDYGYWFEYASVQRSNPQFAYKFDEPVPSASKLFEVNAEPMAYMYRYYWPAGGRWCVDFKSKHEMKYMRENGLGHIADRYTIPLYEPYTEEVFEYDQPGK